MDTDLWLLAKAILGDVADLAPEERAARIATASDGDAALQKEVERLLALDDEAGSYFGALRGTLHPEDAAPAQIGVYSIVGEIGRGGMGAVYPIGRGAGGVECARAGQRRWGPDT